MLCPGDLDHAGGIGRAMSYLIDGFGPNAGGYEIRILNTRGNGRIYWAPWHLLLVLIAMIRLRATGRLALVHVNLASRGSTMRKFMVIALAKVLGVPVLIHLHGGGYREFYRGVARPFRAMLRWMYGVAAQVVVLGPGWRDFVIAELRVAPDRVAVIYNGVSGGSAPIPPSQRQGCHIVFLGRLETAKGLDELLPALAAPAVAALDWRATLAGTGAIARYRDQAAQSGLAGRIDFPGWLDAVAVDRLLAGADLLVLPSHTEGLPVSVIEAMARGIAVIATPVGALPDLLSDGRSVCFVRVRDSAGLADALARMIGDPVRRAGIAAGGQAVYAASCDITVTGRAMLALYDRIALR